MDQKYLKNQKRFWCKHTPKKKLEAFLSKFFQNRLKTTQDLRILKIEAPDFSISKFLPLKLHKLLQKLFQKINNYGVLQNIKPLNKIVVRQLFSNSDINIVIQK